MKTREEIAKFMEGQMDGSIKRPPAGCWHYGRCALRQLMDFMFDGPPIDKKEEVFEPLRLRNSKIGKWRSE